MFVADNNHIFIKPPDVSSQNYMVNYMGAVYYKKKDHCKFPRTLGVMDELYKFIPSLRTNQDFIDTGFALHKEKQNRLALLSTTPVQVDGDRLRPYQRADVNFLKPLHAAGVFNEPRTGKTPTTLELIRAKGTKRNLIVCPASLLYTWEKQVHEWLPNANCYVLEKSKQALTTFAAFNAPSSMQDVLIISKSLLPRLEMAGHTFDLVLVDEAHYLRNYKTPQSKAVFDINADQRFALTGTPTVKCPSDIWGILHFLFPGAYTSYWQFCGRYFTVLPSMHSQGDVVGPINRDRVPELQEITTLNSVSRKRSEVMSWLPEKERSRIYAKMGAKQVKYYAEMKKAFYTMCDDVGTELDAQTVLAQMMRLRQLCLDPRTVGFKEVGCKTETLFQWLSDREEKKPLIIMSMFTGYLKILKDDLEKKGFKVDTIHGEMTNSDKQRAADSFQAGNVDILLCNIISAGTGWTLDHGDTIIFMDNAWNPSDNSQAEDRVTPTTIEKLHKHTIIQLATANTIDETMFDMLQRKESLTNIINNGSRERIKAFLGG